MINFLKRLAGASFLFITILFISVILASVYYVWAFLAVISHVFDLNKEKDEIYKLNKELTSFAFNVIQIVNDFANKINTKGGTVDLEHSEPIVIVLFYLLAIILPLSPFFIFFK